MFSQPSTKDQALKTLQETLQDQTLEKLQEALEDVNQRIQLQRAMIRRGGGFLPVNQCEEMLAEYQKEKAEIEKKIATHPDNHGKETDNKPKSP